jgi:hypothetical protein
MRHLFTRLAPREVLLLSKLVIGFLQSPSRGWPWCALNGKRPKALFVSLTLRSVRYDALDFALD